MTIFELVILVRGTAIDFGVNPSVAERMAMLESRFDPSAVGRHGELGLYQVKIPAMTWALKGLGIAHDWAHSDPRLDPALNTRAAMYIVAQGYERWFTTWAMAQKGA
jgi:soluble lytic murein transglycosylase-like protein